MDEDFELVPFVTEMLNTIRRLVLSGSIDKQKAYDHLNNIDKALSSSPRVRSCSLNIIKEYVIRDFNDAVEKAPPTMRTFLTRKRRNEPEGGAAKEEDDKRANESSMALDDSIASETPGKDENDSSSSFFSDESEIDDDFVKKLLALENETAKENVKFDYGSQ